MDPKRRSEETALYRLYDHASRLLYIGVTVNQKARWLNHRREKPWWPMVTRIEIEWHATRADALQAERTAIETEDPLHNTIHHPVNEPALVARKRRDALRWARGRDSEPYPDGLDWPDVVADLNLDHVFAAISTLHGTGMKTPDALDARRKELIDAIERDLESGAA